MEGANENQGDVIWWWWVKENRTNVLLDRVVSCPEKVRRVGLGLRASPQKNICNTNKNSLDL